MTTLDKAGKHILIVGLTTVIFGIAAAYFAPAIGATSSLNLYTVGAIFLGAMAAGAVTAHDKIKNPLQAAAMSTVAAIIITWLLYSALSQPFNAVVGIVGAGSFISTLVSKLWLGKKVKSAA